MKERPKGRLVFKLFGGLLICLGLIILVTPNYVKSNEEQAASIIFFLAVGAFTYWRGTKPARASPDKP